MLNFNSMGGANAMSAHQILKNNHLGFEEFIMKEINIDNMTWSYAVCGNGKKDLLMIMSNFAGEFISLPIAEQLQKDYRIITLSIPSNADYNKGIEGLYTILKKENVEKIDAYGHSMGASHIQGLIQKYPDIVGKVIFSHSTTVRSLDDVNHLNARDLKAANLMIKLMPIMPLFIIKKIMGGKFKKHLTLSTPEATKELNMLFRESFNKVTKTDFLNMVLGMKDFMENALFSADEFENKKILIIDSENDKLVSKEQQDEMYKLCPNASYRRFKTGGHITMFTQFEETLKVIRLFLL